MLRMVGNSPTVQLPFYTCQERRKKGGRGLCSIEEEFKVKKIKAAVKLYGNGDPAMRWFVSLKRERKS